MYFKIFSLVLVTNVKVHKTDTSFLSYFSLIKDILKYNRFFIIVVIYNLD